MNTSVDQLVVSVGLAVTENADSDASSDVRGIVESGCQAAAVERGWRHSQHRGGAMAVLADGSAAGRLVGPWVHAAYWELRRRNVVRSAPLRIGVGLDLVSDPVSDPASDGAGLADALRGSEPASWLLAAVPRAALLIALSERVHKALLRVGAPCFESANLAEAVAVMPGGPVRAWFQLTGHPTPAVPPSQPPPATTPDRRPDSAPLDADDDITNQIIVERDAYTFTRSTFHDHTVIGSRDGGT
jgi:hypothetical protein